MKQNNEIKEAWVPVQYIFEDGHIESFPRYEVSDKGEVRSLNFNNTGKTKVLKQGIRYSNKDMYYCVCLYKDNKKHYLSVHRIVMSSFDPEGFRHGSIVNHKVERTAESCINEFSNLEWTTQKANLNTDHCRTLQIEYQTNHPTKSKRVKVTFSDGTQHIFPSAKESGRALGINPHTASHCIRNSKGYYKKLNLHFEYAM